jgi:predicted HAD superfamily Cof-like phosphohydrolase
MGLSQTKVWEIIMSNDNFYEDFEEVDEVDEIEDVIKFNRKFGFIVGDFPQHLTNEKLKERIEFIFEEFMEFVQGAGFLLCETDTGIAFMKSSEPQNMVEMADALIDLVYIAKGTAIMMGLPWEELWSDVQRANMSKERGVGKRGHLVDVIKPEGWVGPRTLEILEDNAYVEEWDNDPENFVDDKVYSAMLEASKDISNVVPIK